MTKFASDNDTGFQRVSGKLGRWVDKFAGDTENLGEGKYPLSEQPVALGDRVDHAN